MNDVRRVFEGWTALNKPETNLTRDLNTGYVDPTVNENWLNFSAGWILRGTKLFQGA